MEFKASQRAWITNQKNPDGNTARQLESEEDEQANLAQLED